MGRRVLEQLRWLPQTADWRERLRAFSHETAGSWPLAMALANERLDFVRTNALDTLVQRCFAFGPPPDIGTQPVRLAILGSSTLAHLHAPVRVAGLRRNIWIATYENEYGQYRQDLLDPDSPLHKFAPTVILFSFDAHHVSQGVHAALTRAEAESAFEEARALVLNCWRDAKAAFGCVVMQQTLLDPFPQLLGGNEHRLPGSRSRFVASLNTALRDMADAEDVDLVAVDHATMRDGLNAWHDAALWHRSKQEITPAARPAYGELVARIIAARQGRSRKCLVLDLDDTLWGGVIGDDGLDGIVIGQGSALGEGFAAVQGYVKELGRRGVILAVSSKNDEAIALEPFDRHPDMVLRRADIAAFQANWNDKAMNIRKIAEELSISLDSMVFVDDSPFERAFVREQLPMVAVPELPDDPAFVPALLADAGYFEAVAITGEDRARTAHYQENRARIQLQAASAGLDSYLRNLEMRMSWQRFDPLAHQRIVQLINKTNQFNLTTRCYASADVTAIMQDPNAFGLQIRLADRFGDNGIVAIVIGRMLEPGTVTIDTWLMSCRVLGRQIEQPTLNLVVKQARALGATTLRGVYIPTRKNSLVKDHYEKLGFTVISRSPDGGSVAELALYNYSETPTFIQVTEAEPDGCI